MEKKRQISFDKGIKVGKAIIQDIQSGFIDMNALVIDDDPSQHCLVFFLLYQQPQWTLTDSPRHAEKGVRLTQDQPGHEIMERGIYLFLPIGSYRGRFYGVVYKTSYSKV